MTKSPVVSIAHFQSGQPVFGDARRFSASGVSLVAPELDLDKLVPRRDAPAPAQDLKMDEILDFLEATCGALRVDKAGYLSEALDALSHFSPLSRRILVGCYSRLADSFERTSLEFQLSQQLPRGALDGWVSVSPPDMPVSQVRAFPARIAHVLAGNSPNGAAVSIARCALTKGINLLKLPTNDPLTVTAILRTMADIEPDHPVVRSISAAYWKGGDQEIEDLIFRAQFFDVLIAWGGESAIRSALAYAAPGFHVVTYDPKVSVSLIGREAFATPITLKEVASLGASDATVLNQDACSASVYQFIEGSEEEADAYCEALASELLEDRPLADGLASATLPELREAIEGLRNLAPLFRVWGDYAGHGLVVRASEPVDFKPTGKVVIVVPVASLSEAFRWVTVATQTVGVYPAERKAVLRNDLAARGAQRIVPLGVAAINPQGLPHDGSLPLQQMVRWITDQG
jgi:hypothetical protein